MSAPIDLAKLTTVQRAALDKLVAACVDACIGQLRAFKAHNAAEAMSLPRSLARRQAAHVYTAARNDTIFAGQAIDKFLSALDAKPAKRRARGAK